MSKVWKKSVASDVSKKLNEMDHIFNAKKTIYNWMITNLKVTTFIIQMTKSQVVLYSVFGQFSSQVITPVTFISI